MLIAWRCSIATKDMPAMAMWKVTQLVQEGK